MPVHVRSMEPSDLGVVARLSTELGYPATPAELGERFPPLLRSAGDALFVATGDGEVLGWAHVQRRAVLESAPDAELMALVVGADHRRTGAGRALVEACVAWTRRQGLPKLRVRSNIVRTEAHRFYPALGFVRVKTSHVYDLALVKNEPAGP